MSYLSLKRVEKTYPDGTRAVKGIDLEVAEGEFVVLLGPSGCGKTTTLRMVAGLELATAGEITLGGRNVTHLPPGDRDVGMVFQFYALYPHLSVRENIEFPLRSVGMPRAEATRRADEVAASMGLSSLMQRFPRQLSGGDQQKVSLARAIVRRPAIYLMDEPLGTLDADQKVRLREFIRARQLELKVSTIYVTHDQEEAMSLADRIVVMEGGNVRQAGTPAEVYDRPRDLFVAKFVGSPGMNFVQGEVRTDQGASRFVTGNGKLGIDLEGTRREGPATLGIRSEHVKLAGEDGIFGKVISSEYLGSHRNLGVDSELGRLIVRAPAERNYTRDSTLHFRFDPKEIVLFDEKGVLAP